MNNLIQKLKELAGNDKYKVENNFTWKIPEGCPISIPSELTGNYEQNIYLKHNYASSNIDSLDNRYWLVQQWGGIKGFKSSEKNNKLLKLGGQFEQDLASGMLSKKSFEVISSLSKVASFLDYKNYAIYDSRAVFALNWMLFKYANATEFFPQPKGRSTLLSQYELHTIFNVSGRCFSYYTEAEAYHKYCELLKELSDAVCEKAEPYAIEMLLFTLAVEFIVTDKAGNGNIRDTLTLNLDRS